MLVARAAEAREVLPDALRERGAEVDVVALYETIAERPDADAIEAAQEADYVTFTSSSTVRYFLAAVGDRFPPLARVVSIGPITSAAARDAGLEVHAEAERHDVDGLVEALLADASRQRVMGRPITFLSDYGYADEFAGVCRAVIARIAPESPVIDLTHGVAPRDVLGGALMLADALPHAPAGVHLAVVDPGVGSERRAIAVRVADEDRVLVGPDNGLLSPALEALGGAVEAVDLAASPFRLEPVSATFHGRDLFAPVAARLAGGATLAEAGESLAPDSLARLELPLARVEADRVVAEVAPPGPVRERDAERPLRAAGGRAAAARPSARDRDRGLAERGDVRPHVRGGARGRCRGVRGLVAQACARRQRG